MFDTMAPCALAALIVYLPGARKCQPMTAALCVQR